MLNVLNNNYTQAEELIEHLRVKENELWMEYKDAIDMSGITSEMTLNIRMRWNELYTIMKDANIKTVTEINVLNKC